MRSNKTRAVYKRLENISILGQKAVHNSLGIALTAVHQFRVIIVSSFNILISSFKVNKAVHQFKVIIISSFETLKWYS